MIDCSEFFFLFAIDLLKSEQTKLEQRLPEGQFGPLILYDLLLYRSVLLIVVVIHLFRVTVTKYSTQGDFTISVWIVLTLLIY